MFFKPFCFFIKKLNFRCICIFINSSPFFKKFKESREFYKIFKIVQFFQKSLEIYKLFAFQEILDISKLFTFFSRKVSFFIRNVFIYKCVIYSYRIRAVKKSKAAARSGGRQRIRRVPGSSNSELNFIFSNWSMSIQNTTWAGIRPLMSCHVCRWLHLTIQNTKTNWTEAVKIGVPGVDS